MRCRAVIVPLLIAQAILAAGSLIWAASVALSDSADLIRRSEEVALFVQRADPYDDPDMTYPPTAPPVFTPLVAPFGKPALRAVWLGLNLIALGVLCGAIIAAWGRSWPLWLKLSFALAAAASRPVRGGIGLGQFHLVPTALLMLALTAIEAGWPILAGLMVGAALTKPTMALPFLVYLAIRRRWLPLMVALGLQGALLAFVSAWLGIGPWRLIREWLTNARGQLAAGTIDLPTIVPRLWPSCPLDASQLGLVALIGSGLLIVALRRSPDAGLASLALALSALFTYHRPYDLVLLIPTLAYLIEDARSAPSPPSTLTRTIAAIVFASLLIAPTDPRFTGPYQGTAEAAFVVLVYGFLGWIVGRLARGSPAARPESR
jgi:hypothetical protein